MIARLLHKLQKHSEYKNLFAWTEETKETFESRKKHLSSTPFLALQSKSQRVRRQRAFEIVH